mmetsp:Transcript_2087/g.6117  ORF Transcript_2087/g.6117 Transcript_2087/m.6117 type:complete len:267 (-) Transcript_2087:923-1723(-)
MARRHPRLALALAFGRAVGPRPGGELQALVGGANKVLDPRRQAGAHHADAQTAKGEDDGDPHQRVQRPCTRGRGLIDDLIEVGCRRCRGGVAVRPLDGVVLPDLCILTLVEPIIHCDGRSLNRPLGAQIDGALPGDNERVRDRAGDAGTTGDFDADLARSPQIDHLLVAVDRKPRKWRQRGGRRRALRSRRLRGRGRRHRGCDGRGLELAVGSTRLGLARALTEVAAPPVPVAVTVVPAPLVCLDLVEGVAWFYALQPCGRACNTS